MTLATLDAATVGLLVSLLAASCLYATSGHGGATAYLALFGLFGVLPPVMRPMALIMNVVVAGTGVVRMVRAGQMPWRTLGFLLLGSVPLAYVGGLIKLPATTYRGLLGAALLIAAARLWLPDRIGGGDPNTDHRDRASHGAPRTWPVVAYPVVGALLGFLSGLTGIGGGIFLSPILVLGRLENARRTAALAAAFIVVNSVSGLVALHTREAVATQLPAVFPAVLAVVFAGGFVGSWLAARGLSMVGLRRALGVVLLLSGLKLLGEALL